MIKDTVIVREATCDDAAGVARVHVESWRTTYRGIMPDTVLDSLTPEQRLPNWQRRLCGGPNGDFVFVAERFSGEVIGFASGGAEREGTPGYESELQAIYLLEAAQGLGIGGRLFHAIAERLHRAGMRSMLLWVLAENTPARGFYERIGGEYVQTKTFEIGGAMLDEVAYGWPDLEGLVRSLTSGHGASR